MGNGRMGNGPTRLIRATDGRGIGGIGGRRGGTGEQRGNKRYGERG